MPHDLVYNVIVIDDDVDMYEDYVEIIDDLLEDQGYILKHNRFEELDDLKDDMLADVDLFLVDLKFGSEEKGPEFIAKIRENYCTDILFYSSDSKAIHNSRKKGEFEGVFFAVRDENKGEIKEKIHQLIQKMIKRSNTPLSSRGMVLGCVAEIDSMIRRRIRDYSDELTSADQVSKLMEECIKLFYDSYKGRINKVTNTFGTEFYRDRVPLDEIKKEYKEYSIPDLSEDVSLTDSDKNLRILLSMYMMKNGEDEVYHTIKGISDLLSDRNILAHVSEEKNENGLYQFRRIKKAEKEEYLVLSDEKCVELRKMIIRYHDLLENLMSDN